MTPATPLKQPRGGVVVREMLVNASLSISGDEPEYAPGDC